MMLNSRIVKFNTSNFVIGKLIELSEFSIRVNKPETSLFFSNENGFQVLQYFFELVIFIIELARF